MFNDLNLHILLLQVFDEESDAFRWLFTTLPCLNSRTPLEVISSGGTERVIHILEILAERKK